MRVTLTRVVDGMVMAEGALVLGVTLASVLNDGAPAGHFSRWRAPVIEKFRSLWA
ncbi:MAG: hypothetical protein WBV59_15285 [Anaerolineae bacterium]